MVIRQISYQKFNYGLKEKLSHPFLIPFRLEQNCCYGYKDGILSKINIGYIKNTSTITKLAVHLNIMLLLSGIFLYHISASQNLFTFLLYPLQIKESFVIEFV